MSRRTTSRKRRCDENKAIMSQEAMQQGQKKSQGKGITGLPELEAENSSMHGMPSPGDDLLQQPTTSLRGVLTNNLAHECYTLSWQRTSAGHTEPHVCTI
jgi:hypothetical protein